MAFDIFEVAVAAGVLACVVEAGAEVGVFVQGKVFLMAKAEGFGLPIGFVADAKEPIADGGINAETVIEGDAC